jgi:DNA polymerase
MSLDLDTRQRAMLHEMGVHVWLPQMPDVVEELLELAPENIALMEENTRVAGTNRINEPGAAPALVVPNPPAPAASTRHPPKAIRVVAGLASPTAVTALPDGIADMSWPAVEDAVAHCQACAMCLGRRASVITAPQVATPCDWMVVGDPPDESEERAGQSFVDDAGKLLGNMLRAVGVKRLVPDESATDGPGAAAGRAYLSHVLKCRPALSRAPTGDELATCAHYLRREIALTQPKVILAMGRFAMQVLLSETPPERAKQPLGKLRGQVWRFAGVPVVVTYPPAYLLRSGQDKGKAWADLCLALDVARGDLPQAN